MTRFPVFNGSRISSFSRTDTQPWYAPQDSSKDGIWTPVAGEGYAMSLQVWCECFQLVSFCRRATLDATGPHNLWRINTDENA